MKLAVRIALGAALALVVVFGLSFFMKWWLVALVGAVTGVATFLGTFFLWTADRPEDGYEQVLFDLPNSAISLGLVVVMIAAAFGGGLYLPRNQGGSPLAPEEATAVASMGEQRDALHGILVEYLNDPKSGKLREWTSEAGAASVAIAKLDVPERLSPMLDELSLVAKSMQAALAAQAPCDAGDASACVDARIAASDAQRAETKFDEVAAALGA